ncbi:hypothetical protein CXB49_05125 [Chromobacterium sp. ATCC 53434]|uniref:hypothetical protein n=1 Tax=Chromobacterium sp. (strain ATCC 53434 / SC 14030) TaxID=2059672 RepID=UPI000C78FC3B|nr:hypothetical protein [Chromobacterium sp. ATCC 53434]AUH50246.1 hypothetical protein CXB49_05125 [Chromobacterium sp. ATCC 53434]
MPKALPPPRAAPLCRRCRHYFVTYDPSFPYGCRAMGFSSKRAPCLDMLGASGQPCMRFQPKTDKPA